MPENRDISSPKIFAHIIATYTVWLKKKKEDMTSGFLMVLFVCESYRIYVYFDINLTLPMYLIFELF